MIILYQIVVYSVKLFLVSIIGWLMRLFRFLLLFAWENGD